MKKVIGFAAMALFAVGCSGSSNNGTSTSGSSGTSASSTTSGSSGTSASSTSGSSGSTASSSEFPETSKFYQTDEDDAGNPILDDVALLTTDFSLTCADVENPNFQLPTTRFAIGRVEVFSQDGSVVPPGTYTFDELSSTFDGGNYGEDIQIALENVFPDGGGPNLVAASGSITITDLSDTSISGSFQGQLIDYDAAQNRQIVDAGQVSGSFGNVSFCK